MNIIESFLEILINNLPSLVISNNSNYGVQFTPSGLEYLQYNSNTGNMGSFTITTGITPLTFINNGNNTVNSYNNYIYQDNILYTPEYPTLKLSIGSNISYNSPQYGFGTYDNYYYNSSFTSNNGLNNYSLMTIKRNYPSGLVRFYNGTILNSISYSNIITLTNINIGDTSFNILTPNTRLGYDGNISICGSSLV